MIFGMNVFGGLNRVKSGEAIFVIFAIMTIYIVKGTNLKFWSLTSFLPLKTIMQSEIFYFLCYTVRFETRARPASATQYSSIESIFLIKECDFSI